MIESTWDQRLAPNDRLSVVGRLRDERIELVDLVFSDIAGGAKALTIPAEHLHSTMLNGYRFDGSAVMGGLRRVELDLLLVPDPGTLMIMPSEDLRDRRAGYAAPCCDRMVRRSMETRGLC